MESLSNQSSEMKINLLKLIGISIVIGCLFIHSRSVYADQKLPNSKTVITVDINGNGIPDKVIATYFTRPVSVVDNYRANTCKTVPGKFVRYTMYADRQKNGKVIFEQDYGSTIADYWVHRLEIGRDINRDKRKDLVFYMGDDTSEETIYLLQQAQGFKAISIGGSDLPGSTIDSQRSLVNFDKKVLAKWDTETEVWIGNSVGWVIGDCVAIRAQPDIQSKIISLGFDRSLFKADRSQSVGDWISIVTDQGTSGWISKKHFSFSTPVRWFK
jgi:hypothetical protein